MCCSGTVGGEWRMTEKVRERRDVLFRDCGWGVEDDRESEGEKGCVVQGLFRDCGWGVEDDRESEGEKGCVVQCCSGTVGGEWRMTEKARERRDVLFREGEGLWVGSGG